MAFTHYQCEHCLQTTYMYDDGVDDGIEDIGLDDCACTDDEDDNDDYDDD